MQSGRLIIEKKDASGKKSFEMIPLNGKKISPEGAPKTQQFLPVIPTGELEILKESYIVLAPPPRAMPYGLGTTYKSEKGLFPTVTPEWLTEAWVIEADEAPIGDDYSLTRKNDHEVWANEFHGKPVDLHDRARNTFIRQNEYYAESPSSGAICYIFLLCQYISLMLYLLAYFARSETGPFLGSTPFYMAFIPHVFVTLVVCFPTFQKYDNLPEHIFNRLRDEIYIYSSQKKALLIKKYSTTTFLIYTAYSITSLLYVSVEKAKSIQDEKNLHSIDSVRGLRHIVGTWEYIRRYMAAGEGYKELPLKKNPLFFLPFMGLADYLDETIISPPHRWPPEIERLLWPENKDAPLPNGWQYDTWIPYDIPNGGFDNSELLRQREEQLQGATGHVA